VHRELLDTAQKVCVFLVRAAPRPTLRRLMEESNTERVQELNTVYARMFSQELMLSVQGHFTDPCGADPAAAPSHRYCCLPEKSDTRHKGAELSLCVCRALRPVTLFTTREYPLTWMRNWPRLRFQIDFLTSGTAFEALPRDLLEEPTYSTVCRVLQAIHQWCSSTGRHGASC